MDYGDNIYLSLKDFYNKKRVFETFATRYLEIDPTTSIHHKKVYEVFLAYCDRIKIAPASRIALSKFMRAQRAILPMAGANNAAAWAGIKLKDPPYLGKVEEEQLDKWLRGSTR
jgi:hypothetical protein